MQVIPDRGRVPYSGFELQIPAAVRRSWTGQRDEGATYRPVCLQQVGPGHAASPDRSKPLAQEGVTIIVFA